MLSSASLLTQLHLCLVQRHALICCSFTCFTSCSTLYFAVLLTMLCLILCFILCFMLYFILCFALYFIPLSVSCFASYSTLLDALLYALFFFILCFMLCFACIIHSLLIFTLRFGASFALLHCLAAQLHALLASSCFIFCSVSCFALLEPWLGSSCSTLCFALFNA